MNSSIYYFSDCKTEKNNRTLKKQNKRLQLKKNCTNLTNEKFNTLKKIVLDQDKAYKNAIYLRQFLYHFMQT